jgi:hypothetical protein
MNAPPPAPGQQVEFLRLLQRILTDGSFVATYKYALLHALADLAVLRGEDAGDELVLGTSQIAEQMIELYWRQALPFPAREERGAAVHLRQNTGRPASILTLLQETQRSHGHSLGRVRRGPGWSRLVRDVENVVKGMPLWKLQTVGGERLSFLYANTDRGNVVTLRPGVQYCLRVFHPLIVDLVRGAWLRFVRLHNTEALGEGADLGAFLFGTGRGNLAAYLPILTDVQQGLCLYCRRTVQASPQIDHFIPWARYPLDLAHNLVLAHGPCNRAKADHLAAERHLDQWLRRNDDGGEGLETAFNHRGLAHDRPATLNIARWAYARAREMGGLVWEEGGSLRPLPADWLPRF